MKEYDLVIVGAGPAGMAAAVEADTLGLSVAVVDEAPGPGGQIYRAIETVSKDRRDLLSLLGAEYEAGARLAHAFRKTGCDYRVQTTVWRVDSDGRLACSDGVVASTLKGTHVLVAAGAFERSCAIPGWTLPGVMTAGAAQVLLKGDGCIPDGPIAIAGSGPLLLLVSSQLIAAGADVKVVLETTKASDYLRALPHVPRALRAAEYLIKGLKLRRAIRRADVPLVSEVHSLNILGDDHVRKLTYRVGSSARELSVQTVLLHEGITPNVQITRELECEHTWMERDRYWRPVTNEWGASSHETIYVAGDCGGIVGARASEAAGHLAALDIAYGQQRIAKAERDKRAARWRRDLARHLAIRPFLNALFPPPAEVLDPPDDATTVCRCEEVTAGEIRAAVALGCCGPNQLKAYTRCGMGPCQGRMCGLNVGEIIAAKLGSTMPEVGYYRIRPPIKPVTLNELAAMDSLDD